MSFTYSGNPGASDLDQVRYLIQDTTSPGQQSDEEISWLLSEEGSPRAAAVEACRTLARKYAKQPGSRSIGDVTVTYADLSKTYIALADQIAARAARSSVPIPYLGGLSQGDKDANDANGDHVKRAFPSDEVWSNPGTGNLADRLPPGQ